MWLSATEALARLGSKPQSLYANVSRGRIRAKPDPADSRRSLYREVDVDRVAARSRGRRSVAAAASEAISWGDPVLVSGISTVARGHLFYRGVDVATLAATATLEDVAALLWDGPAVAASPREPAGKPSIEAAFRALAGRAANDPPSAGRGTAGLRIEASDVHATIAVSLVGAGEGLLHERLARHFRRADAADALRQALIVLADHELNASTFAARVAVSTGASLGAGALAGLATLGGPRHGNAAPAVLALAEDIGSGHDPLEALREWLGEGRAVPGFGHPLYPRGDVRCGILLAAIELPPAFARLRSAGEAMLDEAPNIDFALAALTSAYGLPRHAPATIFALARSVGWLAHGIEQATSGQLIRPRARYVGPPLQTAP